MNSATPYMNRQRQNAGTACEKPSLRVPQNLYTPLRNS